MSNIILEHTGEKDEAVYHELAARDGVKDVADFPRTTARLPGAVVPVVSIALQADSDVFVVDTPVHPDLLADMDPVKLADVLLAEAKKLLQHAIDERNCRKIMKERFNEYSKLLYDALGNGRK